MWHINLKCWLPLIICILFANVLIAQDAYEIELTKCISNKPFSESLLGTEMISDSSGYKIPGHLKDFIIKKISVRNKYSSDRFNFLYGIDRDYVSALVNINADSSKTVIVDSNNDLDFTNDKYIIYPLEKKVTEDFVEIRFRYNSEVINFYFQPFTYPKNLVYNNPKEQAHYLLVKSFEVYAGVLKIDDSYHQIFIKNFRLSPYYNKNELEISVIDSTGTYKFYDPKDAIDISGNKILIDSITITGKKLFVKIYKKDKLFDLYGFKKHFYLKPIRVLDNKNNEVEFPLKGRYTLLDFWGTWCGPCKALTPKLILLNSKFKEKLNLISIAGKSKPGDVNEYVKKNKMKWPQIVQNKSNSEIFDSKMFNVNEYPTFILIDQYGKIVSRGTGPEGLAEIETILNK